jgi:hypothetical protein
MGIRGGLVIIGSKLLRTRAFNCPVLKSVKRGFVAAEDA